MKFIETALPGCTIIEPAVFGDARGAFFENWNAAKFAAAGIHANFVQANVSTSTRGVLRGLHYQWP
ncbi:MAG: dTDP-4-dehydrorhamnose 3,5-epimerase family protein, partial [Silanimonas sp.]